MAGTIVIDTDIIDGQDIAAITESIKQKIIAKQKEFILNYYPEEATAIAEIAEGTAIIDRYTYRNGVIEDFDKGFEILLMLVNLIAQQIAQRNANEA